jgi:hypothetical protein
MGACRRYGGPGGSVVDKMPDQVIWGRLADAMRPEEGGEFRLDALLIATPVYNGGYTALLKNALDWASRPTETDRSGLAAMTGKSAALISASPGTLGGIRSQTPPVGAGAG